MSAVGIPYLSGPATIINEALDCIGQSGKIIGDLTDGTTISETARRNYGQGIRQLLRIAHWNFARKSANLTLLGDATGQSSAPVSTQVECPWTYAYAWPIDAVSARWMPFNYANGQPTGPNGIPLTTGGSALVQYGLMPGRFLVSSSNLYPVEVGVQPWDQQPDLQRTQGVGPINRRVILTDACNALLVYTRLVTTIEEWDPLFRQAFVAMMALVVIPNAIEDPKERITQRNAMIAIVKTAIADARVANGNDAGYPQSTDHQPNWITARGGGFLGAAPGFDGSLYSGYTFAPWDSSMQWAGSVF